MIEIKEIQNIEPFNELFFISCYYNSMFSILRYYNKSIMPLLVNCVSTYKYERTPNSALITVDHYPFMQVEEILKEMGIAITTKKKNYNLIDDCIKSILNNKPVIITIDCYYMPIRQEFYMKKHAPHAILIYGFNNITKVFNVIEQRHQDTLTYYKTTLGYSDALKSYEGFWRLDNPYLMETTYYEYDIEKNFNLNRNDINNYLKNYKLNIIAKKKEIERSLKDLDNFIIDFESMISDEFLLRQNVNNLLPGLNNIINSKKVERYKLINLFGADSELTKLNDKIEYNWGLIRGKLVKYMFSSIFKHKEFIDLVANLLSIYKDESLYLEACCDLFSE